MHNKLNTFIKTGKDINDVLTHCNVVYKISCAQCEATYVGQTKRQLATRIKEHKYDINKKCGSPSVITEHRLKHNHDFDWDNIKILDEENSYYKRTVSEMLYIKRQKEGINKQNDTEALPESYLPILNLFPPI